MGALRNIIIAVVVYIVAVALIETMITGTSTGDTLIQTLAPICLAIVPIMVVLNAIGVVGGKK